MKTQEDKVYEHIKDFILNFTSIVYEALPFIVLGAIIAGILEEFLPQKLVTRILPRRRSLGIALGGMLGLIFPMCECGIIPIMRRLLRKGVPLSCCVAYLLAGPIINGTVMLSTYVAFSNPFTFGDNYQLTPGWMLALRVGLAYIVAVSTALIVDRLYEKHGDSLLVPAKDTAESLDGKSNRPFQRLNRIAETGLHDFIDITVYLCLGALLAATVRVIMNENEWDINELSRNYSYLAVILMMGIAVVLCLCSEADAFVAASFTNLVPAAKLSFLVLGPMLDFKLYFMYTRVFRPKLIRTIILSVVLRVFVYCMILHIIWETFGAGFMAAPAPEVSVTTEANP